MARGAVVVLGLVNLVAAGSPVMRTVDAGTGTGTGTRTGRGGLRSSAGNGGVNNYIMWNTYSAGTSSCNLHNSGQKLDIQRIPHGCSGVSVSSWVVRLEMVPVFLLSSLFFTLRACGMSVAVDGSLACCGYRYCG